MGVVRALARGSVALRGGGAIVLPRHFYVVLSGASFSQSFLRTMECGHGGVVVLLGLMDRCETLFIHPRIRNGWGSEYSSSLLPSSSIVHEVVFPPVPRVPSALISTLQVMLAPLGPELLGYSLQREVVTHCRLDQVAFSCIQSCVVQQVPGLHVVRDDVLEWWGRLGPFSPWLVLVVPGP